MKQFMKKIIIFSIPVLIYIILIITIDPYNYFNISKIVNDNVKESISCKLNYPLWKFLRFRENPKNNILLGDSRIYALDTEAIKINTGIECYNFAYGGGSLKEIVETFWKISKLVKLKNVYIGINFNLYNKFNSINRVDEAYRISKNIIAYIFSKYNRKALFSILKFEIFHKKIIIGKLNLTKQEVWEYQLNKSAASFYKRYQYPFDYYEDLCKISNYCKLNNINLIFIIPPTHLDLQQRVNDFGLEKEEIKFKKDLISLGIVYDFDYPSALTKNKDNFGDPFHLKGNMMTTLFIYEIINNKPEHSKYYP